MLEMSVWGRPRELKIPVVIYYNQCGQVRSGCRSIARASLVGDGCERGVDYGGMVGWLPSRLYLHLYFQVQVYLCPFPEASKHTGDQLPSLPPDKSCIDFFTDFFSANGEDLCKGVSGLECWTGGQ